MLIALVLLSVGLLGLAGLQTTSLQNNYSALVRSQAVAMGYSILDKIRANRDAAVSGAYDTVFKNGAQNGSTVAAEDLSAWKQDIGALPGGQGSIAREAPDTFVVQVRWKSRPGLDSPDDTSPGYESITLRTVP